MTTREMRFEKKDGLNIPQDGQEIEIKLCSDYKKRFLSKRCRLEKECKNAKKIRHTLINRNTRVLSVSFHRIGCDGKIFICNACKREFLLRDEAVTCYFNHKAKTK